MDASVRMLDLRAPIAGEFPHGSKRIVSHYSNNKTRKKRRKIEMQLGASSYCTFWHITLQSGLPVYWYPTAAMSKIRYPQVPGNPNLQKVNTKQQRAKICHRRVKNPTNRSYRCNRSHFFCSSLKTSIAINYNSLSNNANHTLSQTSWT